MLPPVMEDGSFNVPFALWIAASIVISTLVAGVAGHRLHRWVAARNAPLARSLPTDCGAWTGLLVGFVIALMVSAGEIELLACSWRDFQICPKVEPTLYRMMLGE